MTYERKKKFISGHLADGAWYNGMTIIEASSGMLRRGTAYQTFDRMLGENLLRRRGDGRSWEQEYRRTYPWERK